MLWNKFNLFTFKIICNIILSITKKTARSLYGNLASWMMVQAPPTTASLFWFYYRGYLVVPYTTYVYQNF